MNREVIALASDHAGFEKKELIRKYLEDKKILYKDFGCFSAESTDYPEYAHLIGKAINEGEYSIGLTFCGSGQGISITANKYPYVRSAICWNIEIAKLARKHNDANICAIPSRFLTDEETIAIIDTYLNTKFEGGRHLQRIKKIPI